MWNQEKKYQFLDPLRSSDMSNEDFIAESSRKRKAGAIDQSEANFYGINSQPVSQYNWLRDVNQQYFGGTGSNMNIQGNNLLVISNITPQSIDLNLTPHQNGRYQFQSLNYDENLQNAVSNGMSDSSSISHSQSNQNRTMYKLPFEEISTPTSLTPLNYNMANTVIKDAMQPGNCLNDNINFSPKNTLIKGYSLFESHNQSTGSMGSYSNLHPRNDAFAHHEIFGQTGSSITANHDVAGPMNVSSMGVRFLEPQVVGGIETSQFNQNNITEVRANSLDNREAANHAQNYGDSASQVEKAEGNVTSLLLEGLSSKTIDSSAKHWDGESKPRAGSSVEKLWDGTLQLNSSTTTSAVAFFKSGEKAPDVVWSKSIEVKGKVKLEAFEKYIQELPRSRSRAMMVTSLCWKVGSSESGLAGMKEVTKNYKTGFRVGCAHMYPGNDIYICPRSDEIITILAKYGFFSGLFTVEDDKDSLIGCVVWRRDVSDIVVEKLDDKKFNLVEQLLGFTPNLSSFQQTSERLSQLGSNAGSAPLENQTSTELTKPTSSQAQVEVWNSFAGYAPNIISEGTPAIQMTMEKVMPPQTETGYLTVDLTPTYLPGPPQSLETMKMVAPEEDDLPEFDFRTACGVSLPEAPISSAPRFATDGANNVDDFISPIPARVKPVAFPNQLPQVQISTEFAIRSSTEIPPSKQTGNPSPFSLNSTPSPRKLWDDDDMPEWCPPDLEGQHRQQPATFIPSIPPSPSRFRDEFLPPPPPFSSTPSSFRNESLPPPPASVPSSPSFRSESVPPPPPFTSTPSSSSSESLPPPPPFQSISSSFQSETIPPLSASGSPFYLPNDTLRHPQPSIPPSPSRFRSESLPPLPPFFNRESRPPLQPQTWGARPSSPSPSRAPHFPFGTRPPLPLPYNTQPPPIPRGALLPPPLSRGAPPPSFIRPPMQPRGSSFTFQQRPVQPLQNRPGYNFIPELRTPSRMYDVSVMNPTSWKGSKP